MAKKRTQAAAGLTGGANEGGTKKKRKAAEASKAKISKIADDEGESTEESEFDDVKIPAPRRKGKQDVKKPKQDITNPDDMPLVAPGFHLFEGFCDTVRNTEIAALTKSEPDMEQSRKYGFTLKPVIVTQGPLVGKTILVLEPTAVFRFLDLPPEIRNMVYGYLIEEHGDIEIWSHKPVGKERRPVTATFRGRYGRSSGHGGQAWDKQNGKWIGQTSPMHNLLRVCKQVQAETGALIYGDTKFSFRHWSDATLFLNTVGSMRRYIRHVELPNRHKGSSGARSTLKTLQDASDLQDLTVKHDDLCSDTPLNRYNRYYRGFFGGVQEFVNMVTPMFKGLQNTRDASAGNLLDLIVVKSGLPKSGKCVHCKPGKELNCVQCRLGRAHYEGCIGHHACKVVCDEHEDHCEELAEEVRTALAKALKIEV